MPFNGGGGEMRYFFIRDDNRAFYFFCKAPPGRYPILFRLPARLLFFP